MTKTDIEYIKSIARKYMKRAEIAERYLNRIDDRLEYSMNEYSGEQTREAIKEILSEFTEEHRSS